MMKTKISVLTATYNRANYLKKLYDSLVDNVSDDYEIEWLIMDDGSTDDTEAVCSEFASIPEGRLSIKYFKQSNQGKMDAINNLAQYVTGELWIECDSDDYFVSNCFGDIVAVYKTTSVIDGKQNLNGAARNGEYYALAFLKQDQNGNNMGNNFPKKDDTMFNLYFNELENGEKALVFFTSVRKDYKYELENGEKFVTEARMHHKMDLHHKIFCVNQTIMVCEYQDEGYSKNIEKQFIKNPYGYYEYFHEILADMDTSKIAFSKRLYVIKHYILFTYLTKKKLNLKISGICNKLLLLILYIPGMIKSRKMISTQG